MFKAKDLHQAIDFLGSKVDRPYGAGRATRVVKTENGVGIKYHNTVVVEYTESGIVLNTGGWQTSTTKERMNTALDNLDTTAHISVYQNHNVWYIEARRRNPAYIDEASYVLQPDGSRVWTPNPAYVGGIPYWLEDYKFVFFDGVTIGYDGKVINPPAESEDSANLAENKRRQKLIKAFCKELKNQLESGTLPAPSGGDCWYCYMREVKTGKPLGEAAGVVDHLLSHIEERYIVPSLIWQIAEERGSRAMCGYLAEMWRGNPDVGFFKDHTVRDLPPIVARYLKARLLTANNQNTRIGSALEALKNLSNE